MKRSRETIANEYARNVRAKTLVEESIKRLDEEYEAHPDTISGRVHESIRFLVTASRFTSLETNHTLQNYGYMKIESWVCKFTLDGKIYVGILGRTLKKNNTDEHGKETSDDHVKESSDKYGWGGFASINQYNKHLFELVSRKEAIHAAPYGIQKFRTKIFDGTISNQDIWKEALKSQDDNEEKAIVMLVHLFHNPTDEIVDTSLISKNPPPQIPEKLEGFELISLRVCFEKEEDS